MPCIFPIYLKKQETYVPCSKCLECRKRYASAWSFRLMQEEKVSLSANFITLTYATNHVPINRKGYLELKKRDLQLFFKRLRKVHSNNNQDKTIKYYAVGEYGSRSNRPHYHVILFNADISLIQNAWGLGDVHYGSVSEASVGYTLKYICKPKRNLHDREKEFSLMSKGLGISYLSDKMCRWHLEDLENRMYVNISGGKKASMPRYYKEKMYYEDERKAIAEVQRILKNEEQLSVIINQTFKQHMAYNEYKKKQTELLLTYADKGRNKI